MNKSNLCIIFVVIILVLAAGVCGLYYATLGNSYRPVSMMTAAPHVDDSSQQCSFPKDLVKNDLFITIGSLQIDQTKKTVENLITAANGMVMTLNDGVRPDIGTRTVQFMVLVPREKFKDFAAALDSLGQSPNNIENKNSMVVNKDSLTTNCQNLVGQLAALQYQEKSYEDQLQSNLSFEDRQTIISKITELKQQIFYLKKTIDDFGKNLDKSTVSISLTNEGIGG